MKTILFDDGRWHDLLPLTATRPVSYLRCGILTIHEKWELALNTQIGHLTQGYLSQKFPTPPSSIYKAINGGIFPNVELCAAINALQDPGQCLMHGDTIIAAVITESELHHTWELKEKINFQGPLLEIKNLWNIFKLNAVAIQADFEAITHGRESAPLSPTNGKIGSHPIFLEEGAKVEYCNFNTTQGPIYIGKDAEIMEGGNFRGPIAFCEHSITKLATKIYGATTIGPGCRAGGELNNAVMMANSNKGHDGFLGNSVIGEWCNIGADTNNSNLKNNYDMVKLWNYPSQKFVNTGEQFCGLFMADHSKCAINTMFNTGTVVGVSCNIFGDGFPRNYIPHFSWGGAGGFNDYKLDKALESMDRVLERRGQKLSEVDKSIFEKIYAESR